MQHRDVGNILGHGRNEGHGGRPRPDHHDPLADVVEVLGPFLGMDDRPGEAFPASELRRVALPVAVVPGTHVEEPAGHGDEALGSGHGVGVCGRHRPSGVGAGPFGGRDPVSEADVAGQVVLGDRLPQVVQDDRSVGDRLLLLPRLEAEAQGVHVAVGPYARIPEQVPRAADVRPALQDGEGRARAPVLEVDGAADAGDPGADDQDVDVFPRCPCHGPDPRKGLKPRPIPP